MGTKTLTGSMYPRVEELGWLLSERTLKKDLWEIIDFRTDFYD